ncbi:MAG: M15 family metallopeptidase [Flavobacteriaceae bacterium]|nr:M15 family metallopeptidase [Flavobacteriaceae bacterium]
MKTSIVIKAIVILLFLSFTTISDKPTNPPLHEGFVYLKDVIPNLRSDLRYYGPNNFIGQPLKGYNAPKCILSKKAADALTKVQTELERIGFGLLIYDAYRPQQAVDNMISWSEDDSDTLMKEDFYPNIDKKDLFKEGYISKKSGHSRGSTVDLTIVSLKTRHILNMGSPYDLLDEKSSIDYPNITKNQRALRMLLRRRMEKHGFKSYDKEWWHFTLKNEPFPNTYFNFPVE